MTSTILATEQITATTSVPTARGARRITLGATGWTAAGFLIALVIAAVVVPAVVHTSPNAANLLDSYEPSSAHHWLGTDATGRDIAIRLVYGSRTSLAGPALIVLLALLISVPLALVAAWRRGWVGAVVNRVIDVIFSIPGILLAILAVAVFGPGLRSASIALAIAYTPYVARVILAATQAQRRLPYVEVLTVQGVRPRRIMVAHVLRNIAPILVGQATITFAYALIDLASLSFLGLGVQAPQADWGVMVSDRDSVLQGHPQQVVYTSVLIVATVLSLLVLGSRLSGENGVRRHRRRRKATS